MSKTQTQKPLLSRRLQALVSQEEADKIAALAAARGDTVSNMLRGLALAEVGRHEGAVKQVLQARTATSRKDREGQDNDEDSRTL